MKQYMILASMIVLGVFIFGVIAGGEGETINTSLQGLWQEGVKIRTYTP